MRVGEPLGDRARPPPACGRAYGGCRWAAMMPRRAEMSAARERLEQPVAVERVRRRAPRPRTTGSCWCRTAGRATARSPAMSASAFW